MSDDYFVKVDVSAYKSPAIAPNVLQLGVRRVLKEIPVDRELRMIESKCTPFAAE